MNDVMGHSFYVRRSYCLLLMEDPIKVPKVTLLVERGGLTLFVEELEVPRDTLFIKRGRPLD